MKFIEEVEDVFEINGRGCVVVPGVPLGFEPNVGVGAKLQFFNPSGSTVTATLKGLEMINRGKQMKHAPFSLDSSVKKGDIEMGAKIYLIDCSE